MGRPCKIGADDALLISETDRRYPPSKEQMKEILIILDDFGVKKEMPTFRTFAELDVFRRTAINQLLAS